MARSSFGPERRSKSTNPAIPHISAVVRCVRDSLSIAARVVGNSQPHKRRSVYEEAHVFSFGALNEMSLRRLRSRDWWLRTGQLLARALPPVDWSQGLRLNTRRVPSEVDDPRGYFFWCFVLPPLHSGSALIAAFAYSSLAYGALPTAPMGLCPHSPLLTEHRSPHVIVFPDLRDLVGHVPFARLLCFSFTCAGRSGN